MGSSDSKPWVKTLENGIGSAIAEATEGSEMISRWVTLVETIDGDGKRGMWLACADGMTPWDSIGMLRYAISREDAQVRRAMYEGEDNGEG